MFHLQDEHTKQSIKMKLAIPFLTEIIMLPIIALLLQKSTPWCTVGLIASIPCKRFINTQVEHVHRRSQEQKADAWAVQKNNDKDTLNAFMQYRESVVKNGCEGLFIEYAASGQSRSKVFDTIAKLFADSDSNVDTQRFDTDEKYADQCWQKANEFYNKLKQQPRQWPLRLLAYVFDPDHPFPLDTVAIVQDKIKELATSH